MTRLSKVKRSTLRTFVILGSDNIYYGGRLVQVPFALGQAVDDILEGGLLEG